MPWALQVSSEQGGRTGSSWIWIYLGVGLMCASGFDAAHHLRGFRMSLSFLTPHPIMVPVNTPAAPSIHHSTFMGWTVPSLPQVSCGSLVPGGVASLPSTPVRCQWVSVHLEPMLTGSLPEAPGQLVVRCSLCCPHGGFLSLVSSFVKQE